MEGSLFNALIGRFQPYLLFALVWFGLCYFVFVDILNKSVFNENVGTCMQANQNNFASRDELINFCSCRINRLSRADRFGRAVHLATFLIWRPELPPSADVQVIDKGCFR